MNPSTPQRYERPPIPRGGLVETTNAKLLARFGKVSDCYAHDILKGAPVPRHVEVLAEKFKRERPWEKMDPEPLQATEAPPCPTCAEVSAALDNLRAVYAHVERTYGPKMSPELIKFLRWTAHLNRDYEKSKEAK